MLQDDHPWIRSYFHGPRGGRRSTPNPVTARKRRPGLALRLRPEPFRTPEADHGDPAHYVAVGVFVLVVVLLAFGGVLWLSRTEFSQVFAPYYIFFKGSVAGLSKGRRFNITGIRWAE